MFLKNVVVFCMNNGDLEKDWFQYIRFKYLYAANFSEENSIVVVLCRFVQCTKPLLIGLTIKRVSMKFLAINYKLK